MFLFSHLIGIFFCGGDGKGGRGFSRFDWLLKKKETISFFFFGNDSNWWWMIGSVPASDNKKTKNAAGKVGRAVFIMDEPLENNSNEKENQ